MSAPRDDGMFAALARVVGAIGGPDFADAAFALAERGVGADHLVVYLVGRDELRGLLTRGKLAPRIADTLNQRYLERYHLLDQSLPSLWDVAGATPLVQPFDARLQASPAYHAFFFEHAGLCDKLAVVTRRGDCLLLCSLYRLAASGPFDDTDFARARDLAAPLAAAAWLHADKVALPLAPAAAPEAAGGDAGGLLRTLSRREMDVCRRLLVGASNEGVALDLAISPHTVRTLRKRIYKKLGVSSLGDLFSKYRGLVAAGAARRA